MGEVLFLGEPEEGLLFSQMSEKSDMVIRLCVQLNYTDHR